MCHHRGDIPGEIPEWTSEHTESDADEELPPFLNEDGEEVAVLTDGAGEQ